MNYRFHDEARSEYREAILFYELQRRGLGQEFVLEFEAALKRVLSDPESYAVVDEEIRSINLQRFSYALNYAVIGSEVFILAVAHHSRRPGYWRSRWSSE